MGKASNERRKQIFLTLKKNGQLDKPAIWPKKTKRVSPPEVKSLCYCLDNHGDNLPDSWRRCIDCPIDS